MPVIAIGGYYHANDGQHRALREEILQYKHAELAGVKMKVGRATLAEDIERVHAVREAEAQSLFWPVMQIRLGSHRRQLNFVVPWRH